MSKQVLVTGANGHLGYNLTKLLVESGYMVRAGVRDKDNEIKTIHLRALDNVEIINCDITDLDQMIDASKGVSGIFHVAAFFAFSVKDPEENLIKPTVEGTLNALKAAKENGINKVVYTSSTIAMGNSSTQDHPLDENSWNVNTKIPYSIAKYRAEKQAWEFAKENGINMVSVSLE